MIVVLKILWEQNRSNAPIKCVCSSPVPASLLLCLPFVSFCVRNLYQWILHWSLIMCKMCIVYRVFCFAINGILSFLLDLQSRCGVILLFANIFSVMIVVVYLWYFFFTFCFALPSFIRGQCVWRENEIGSHYIHFTVCSNIKVDAHG